jgi:Domain of unknown function (DUF6429)
MRRLGLSDRLKSERQGYITDPKGKARSVWLTDEGARLSEELFQKYFALAGPS